LELLVLMSSRCQCCGEERGRRERVLASGADEATASLAAATWDRQSVSAGEREQAGGAEKAPREGDGKFWAKRWDRAGTDGSTELVLVECGVLQENPGSLGRGRG
jgi:hypothetical protein